MKRRFASCLLGIAIALSMLLSLAMPALALTPIGVSPVAVHERMETEFEAVIENLDAYLAELYGEDYDAEALLEDEDFAYFIEWVDVLSIGYEAVGDSLASFMDAEEARDSRETDPDTGDVYYTKANLQSYIFGVESKADDASALLKGVFNRTDGRFTVDETTNLYFDDKSTHLSSMLDYVQSEKAIYIQYGYYDDYDADRNEHIYTVMRALVSDGHIRMCVGELTESQLATSRVKSPFISWDAFCIKDADSFEFDGKSIKLRSEGVSSQLSASPQSASADDEE